MILHFSNRQGSAEIRKSLNEKALSWTCHAMGEESMRCGAFWRHGMVELVGWWNMFELGFPSALLSIRSFVVLLWALWTFKLLQRLCWQAVHLILWTWEFERGWRASANNDSETWIDSSIGSFTARVISDDTGRLIGLDTTLDAKTAADDIPSWPFCSDGWNTRRGGECTGANVFMTTFTHTTTIDDELAVNLLLHRTNFVKGWYQMIPTMVSTREKKRVASSH